MRPDFAKSLFDGDGRRSWSDNGGNKALRRMSKKDPENAPEVSGRMARRMGKGNVRYHWDNATNRPLKRFLESRVGKPWNDVYTEILESPDFKKGHFRYYLEYTIDWMVCRTPKFLEDGRVCHGEHLSSNYGAPIEDRTYNQLRDGHLYVDLKGLLQRYKEVEERKGKFRYSLNDWHYPKNPPAVQHPTLGWCVSVNGIWYSMEVRDPTEAESKDRRFYRFGPPSIPRLAAHYELYSKFMHTWMGANDGSYHIGGHMFGSKGPKLVLKHRQLNTTEIKKVKEFIDGKNSTQKGKAHP